MKLHDASPWLTFYNCKSVPLDPLHSLCPLCLVFTPQPPCPLHHHILHIIVKVAKSHPTLCNPVDYTVPGILQARMLEWVALPFSRGSSQPRDRTHISRISGRFFTSWTTKEAAVCFLNPWVLFCFLDSTHKRNLFVPLSLTYFT